MLLVNSSPNVNSILETSWSPLLITNALNGTDTKTFNVEYTEEFEVNVAVIVIRTPTYFSALTFVPLTVTASLSEDNVYSLLIVASPVEMIPAKSVSSPILRCLLDSVNEIESAFLSNFIVISAYFSLSAFEVALTVAEANGVVPKVTLPFSSISTPFADHVTDVSLRFVPVTSAVNV